MDKENKFFQILALFYGVAFLFFLIRACLRVRTIISLKKEAYNIIDEMIRPNPPIRNVDNGLLTFQSSEVWLNPTPELKMLQLKYNQWCYKLGRINNNSYASWAQNFRHMQDSLVNFVNLSSEYCQDEWAEMLKNTFSAPSKILKYIGMPINFISKALDILLGSTGLYSTINTIWQFIVELLQKISHW